MAFQNIKVPAGGDQSHVGDYGKNRSVFTHPHKQGHKMTLFFWTHRTKLEYLVQQQKAPDGGLCVERLKTVSTAC